MEYKIVNFDEMLGRITVETVDFGDFVIDLPLNDNNEVLEGVELHKFILGFLPVYHVERTKKLARGILNANNIKAMVVPATPKPDVVVESTSDQLKIAILTVLREEGLIL